MNLGILMKNRVNSIYNSNTRIQDWQIHSLIFLATSQKSFDISYDIKMKKKYDLRKRFIFTYVNNIYIYNFLIFEVKTP